jgi:urease accessory protein
MLEVFELKKRIEKSADYRVVLTFDERQKSRHKTLTECGKELGWFLERGIVLAQGDILCCKSGETVLVMAANEAVSQVENANAILLTKAAYHLGNRHVPLQIGEGFVRYLQDHVLDEMIRGFALNILHLNLPFQPENGAYHGHQQKSVLFVQSHKH